MGEEEEEGLRKREKKEHNKQNKEREQREIKGWQKSRKTEEKITRCFEKLSTTMARRNKF